MTQGGDATDVLRDEERKRIVALDKAHLWHPYTEMSAYLATEDPLVIARAEGSRLTDENGRSYIDGNASWWTSLLGHGHPRLLSALHRQADQLAHVSLAGITHRPAAELAARLVEVAPEGLNRVFFSDDGSTAVEVAVKLAVQYFAQNGEPRRHRCVSFLDAFHGETLGCTALSGVRAFRAPFERIVMDVIRVASAADGVEQAFAELERVLREEGQEVAAVVLEPLVQGAGGMRMYPPSFLKKARALASAAGVLLVFDEVFTGYGRTGPMWASEHAGVSPDMMCVAKGFSGGILPMAATLVTERLFQGFLGDRSRAFYYGHTFCGNPLGASVALEVLRIYAEEDILGQAATKGRRVASAFSAMGSLAGVENPRSLGMIGALDLCGESGYLADAGWRVYKEALRRGAYLRPLGNVIYIAPSLCIPEPELDELLEIVADSVMTVTGKGS